MKLNCSTKRNIILPKKYSKELAEFLGILYGDGYMNKYKDYHYLIEIAGHSEKDFDYHDNYLKKLIEMLFNIKPNFRLRKKQKTLYTQINSKDIFLFLESAGMIRGKKKILIIPFWIKNNLEYSKAFIKGLYDTDGSLILRKRGQNSISLGLKDKELIFDVKSFLEGLGYFVCYHKEKRYDKRGFESTNYKIRINRKKLIKRFIEEIGSSNPYKLGRFNKI